MCNAKIETETRDRDREGEGVRNPNDKARMSSEILMTKVKWERETEIDKRIRLSGYQWEADQEIRLSDIDKITGWKPVPPERDGEGLKPKTLNISTIKRELQFRVSPVEWSSSLYLQFVQFE
jgi:hypothetical protein